MPRPRRRRSLLRRLALLVILGVMGLAMFEGVLRMGWIPNALHARHAEEATPLADPERTVLILGDSFIVPRGMLGRLLREAGAEQGVLVENVATSGTGPFEYLAALRRHIDEVQPDLVLLSFYAGNDLTDVQNNPLYEGVGGQAAVAIDRTSGLPVLRDSYAFQYLRARIGLWRARRFDEQKLQAAGFAPDVLEDARAAAINPYLIRLALDDPDHFMDNVLMEREENLAAWDKVRELITDIHETCRLAGAELKIVAFPHSIQVNRDLYGFLGKLTFRLDETALETSRPQERLAALCAELHVPLLDLLPVFRARADESFYQAKDDHLNAAGNELAAERIRAFAGF